MATKPYIIALEEHYLDAEIKRHYTGTDSQHAARVTERLDDVGQGRIADMDAAGIDLQVLSHANPGMQKMDAETAVRLARGANDRLQETVRAHPDRFAAFAAIPTPDPKAAADELERAVTKLGFKGALVNGLTNDYVEQYPSLLRAAWGFTVETATQGVRLVLSGVFDRYPNLRIIIGHFGEGLPFLLWRINMGFERDRTGSKCFRDVFCEHFYVTTSGFFSDPALLHCMMEMGIDRIMFSVDYPFVDNPPGTKWLETLPLSADDQVKLLSGNAKRILKL